MGTVASPGLASPGSFSAGSSVAAGSGSGPLPPAPYGGNPVVSTLDSSVSVVADTFGSGVAVANAFGSGVTEPTVQLGDITLSEFNDVSISLSIMASGSAFNLTGYAVQMLLKTAAGTPDMQALILSSAGSNPAITITNASEGLATVAIPHAALQNEQYQFYRVDVVTSAAAITTCAYGAVGWVSL